MRLYPEPMKSCWVMVLIAMGCSAEQSAPRVSRDPISVRGWIMDVERPVTAAYPTRETEAARRVQLFQATNVWVDNAPYVSGGVAENGAFILLDVPPGNPTITFSAPGAPAAKLVLQNVPGNADLIIPGIVLRRDSVALTDPKAVQVRMAAHISNPQVTAATVIVAGTPVPITNTPYSAMTDRHDFPNPPGTFAPLATVR
jgi:hypothetical protein